MLVLSVAYLAALVWLAAAGAAKVSAPDGLAGALRLAGLPVPPPVVRVAAAGEVALAAGAFAVGGRPIAGLVGASYVLFAGFVGWVRLRRLPVSTCGCFGHLDVPPSGAHLVVNLAAAAAAIAWAVAGAEAPLDRLAASTPAGAATIVAAALGAALAAGWLVSRSPRRSGGRDPVVGTPGGPVDEAGGRYR